MSEVPLYQHGSHVSPYTEALFEQVLERSCALYTFVSEIIRTLNFCIRDHALSQRSYVSTPDTLSTPPGCVPSLREKREGERERRKWGEERSGGGPQRDTPWVQEGGHQAAVAELSISETPSWNIYYTFQQHPLKRHAARRAWRASCKKFLLATSIGPARAGQRACWLHWVPR